LFRVLQDGITQIPVVISKSLKQSQHHNLLPYQDRKAEVWAEDCDIRRGMTGVIAKWRDLDVRCVKALLASLAPRPAGHWKNLLNSEDRAQLVGDILLLSSA
jgi:hypothetical protein